ncbi:unnamed protein product [Aspergillus oryzae]|uniref:protein-histidine N-methyltransferase n=2 Tax=Aspergillus oryzae TaxID=5062 RepID=A0AAN4YBA9_ASPOZ|nr:unnamed protein product [Aspergillus oryzae]GMF83731.1 unnamed protein product [Aspergillus oryzae]GMG06072.1 unnamed protein product [Aspergillus oryzae]GMG23567.1 unnamed protein product [Aspergillus oryzae]GMG52055.1 unnamed protein product [Aspergillus oryzae var. brunneus]
MLSHLWPYRKKFETKLKDEEAPKTIATKHSNLESKSLAYPYGSYGISRRILCPQNLAYTLRLYQTITVSTLSTRAPRLLPSQVSFNKLNINTTQDDQTSVKTLTLARREVFDIRTQLMAEDTADYANEELISGLEKGDITPNIYEGGFKTWECSVDLAKLVANENILSNADAGDRHIIELGAGTAVPSLALFAQSLSNPKGSSQNIRFTFADYNSVVLRLVTLPNLLLTWSYIVMRQKSVSVAGAEDQVEEELELDITPELLEAFKKDIAERGISIEFISGAWSPAFVDLVFTSGEKAKHGTLVLASETIYSPASLRAFSETLLALIRRPIRAGGRSRALLAAKKVYFGVGGGVDEFLEVFNTVGGDELDVKERMDVKSEGVGRIVLEIAPKGLQ